MHHPVQGSHRRHRIFENLVPLRKDEVRRNSNRPIFVPFGQEDKQDFHFFAVLLHIPDVI